MNASKFCASDNMLFIGDFAPLFRKVKKNILFCVVLLQVDTKGIGRLVMKGIIFIVAVVGIFFGFCSLGAQELTSYERKIYYEIVAEREISKRPMPKV